MHTMTEWVASIPDAITPREGQVIIDTALADAKEATDAIVADFKSGGTLPPPPWPQPDELVTAIKALEGGKLMLGQAIQLGYGDHKFPHTDNHVVRLINGGRALYAGIEKMQHDHREGRIRPEDAPKLAAKAAGKLAEKLLPTGGGGLIALIALVWAADYFGGDE